MEAEELNLLGRLHISFNVSMQDENVNLTLIDENKINLTLLPNQNTIDLIS